MINIVKETAPHIRRHSSVNKMMIDVLIALSPVVIFSINTNDIINVPQDTIQYLYDTKKHKLIKYDNQELKELFNSELFIKDSSSSGKVPFVSILIL